jgi:hypothetical protein
MGFTHRLADKLCLGFVGAVLCEKREKDDD